MSGQSPVQQTVTMKITAFREFAAQLAGQVVEQMCQEYEREVGVIHAELWQYRLELERVAELLGKQLGHSKQLHMMLEQMGEVHSSVVAQMEGIKQAQPDTTQIHDMLEQMRHQYSSVVNSHLGGVSEAYTVAQAHKAKKDELEGPMISAEAEFNRILEILRQPLIPGQMPQPTVAPIPQTAPAPMVSPRLAQPVMRPGFQPGMQPQMQPTASVPTATPPMYAPKPGSPIRPIPTQVGVFQPPPTGYAARPGM